MILILRILSLTAKQRTSMFEGCHPLQWFRAVSQQEVCVASVWYARHAFKGLRYFISFGLLLTLLPMAKHQYGVGSVLRLT